MKRNGGPNIQQGKEGGSVDYSKPMVNRNWPVYSDNGTGHTSNVSILDDAGYDCDLRFRS